MGELSQGRLREVLSYNEKTGVFIWRVNNNRGLVGTEAGTVHALGYVRIKVAGKSYMAHRLVYLHVCGVLPTSPVDHVNRNNADNRFRNLRLCSTSQNNANRKFTNLTGYRGVYRVSGGKYLAQIRKNGKLHHLCRTKCSFCAAKEYNKAAIRLHGEFATLNDLSQGLCVC